MRTARFFGRGRFVAGGASPGRGPLVVALLLLIPASLSSCSSSADAVTAVRVTAEWGGMRIDQLEYAIMTSQGALQDPERRPAVPGAALTSGTDIVIYLPDRLAGQPVDCRVTGYYNGLPQGHGQARADVVSGGMVEVRVALPGAVQPDGGSPPDVGGGDGGGPRRKPNGQSCDNAQDCTSGHCVDGVCCDRACSGACQGCNLPGRAGSCSAVAAGTGCQPGTCSGNLLLGSGACDGGGSCVIESSRSCGDYLCDPATGSCRSSCASTKECNSPNVCSTAGRCGAYKPLGSACTTAAECTSGNCVDGACCGSASCDFCFSCNVAGSAGSCQPVPDGSPEPNGLCPAQPVSTCGLDGSCNGQGACRAYPNGTFCRTGRICFNGVCR
jgi:hypothetical protein